MRLDSIRSLGRDLLARTSPSSHERAAPGAELEDQVRELIYGPRAGSVARRRSAGEASGGRDEPPGQSVDRADPARARRTGAQARAPRGAPVGPDPALEGQLAAALLGELDCAAREQTLRRAAAKLSKNLLDDQPRRASGLSTDDGAPRSSLADDGALPARLPAARSERARRARALPADDRARAKMPRYRIVISGGRSRARQVEFSTRAPSARGAVAAQLSDKTATVSAANEAEPADRFSWCAPATCACTPVAFTDLARGGKLDREGRCPACGVQVLPPRARTSALGAVAPAARAIGRLRRRA